MDKAIRSVQFADQIRDYLAAWFVRDLPGLFVTVNQVTFNPSITQAKAWINIHGEELTQSKINRVIRLQGKYQRDLVRTISKRSMPQLVFEIEANRLD